MTTREKTKRWQIAGAAVAAFALVVSACGSDDAAVKGRLVS